MRILLCHNYYRQRGGEDESFEAEAKLLECQGQEVVRLVMHNDALNAMSGWTAARKTIWNREAYQRVEQVIRDFRPAVMHCTNTFPLMSSAVYYAAKRHAVPVVQALRNYRWLCPNAILYRDGQICESCIGKAFSWPSIAHACYRESRVASAVVSLQNGIQNLFGTWKHSVDRYFAPTEFTRAKFIQAGFPAERISVKPNFIFPDPGPCFEKENYAVFVGRLTQEKGIETLLRAWRELPANIPLKIVGEGPLSDRVRQAAEEDIRIHPLGQRSADEVLAIIGRARLLIMPSNWYETFGRVIIEAFSRGTPVLASRLGAMSEIVTDGQTGLLFEAGNAEELVRQTMSLLEAPERLKAMGDQARSDFMLRFTADRNYEMLMKIYAAAGAKINSEVPSSSPLARVWNLETAEIDEEGDPTQDLVGV